MAKFFPKIESSDFDWNNLKYALCVARSGGLSAAAKLLGTSASTVARHIQQLERQLGQPLFLRQQTGYLLTDQGKEVLTLIANVEQALLALERHQGATSSGTEISGLIRVACAEIMASHLIVPRLPLLYQAHPKLRVELVTGIGLADLSRREADISLRLVSPGSRGGEQDYVGHLIGHIDFSLFRSRRHPEQADWISWGEDWQHMPIAEAISKHHKHQPPRFISNNAHLQLFAARHGIGTAMLPAYMANTDSDLQEVQPGIRVRRDVWLAYHRDLKASQRVQAMREYLTDCVRQLPDADQR